MASGKQFGSQSIFLMYKEIQRVGALPGFMCLMAFMNPWNDGKMAIAAQAL